MPPSPFESFKSSLKAFFNTDIVSDLVVACEGREFKVHRLILCAHSKYFAKQLNGPWKESSEKLITIKDFDSSVVEAMLYFMYNFNYTNTSGSSTMVFDAQVYQIADKYDFEALKCHAKDRFGDAIDQSWNMDDFPLAVTVVYTTTPAEDRGLRDLVVETSHWNIDSLITRDDFCEMLRNVPDFAADLVPFLCGKLTMGVKGYNCPGCSRLVHFKFNGSIGYCPECGSKRSDWSSNEANSQP
ncbi:btb poz [Fusarium albosuccineum]|uniref:Btb poz n=1 Tax=Fusarium albosuccineum TaxID=1237068 RepID=A0A8H4L563_9HYPO|nr:btb poz [Fusarium albosuccineum]